MSNMFKIVDHKFNNGSNGRLDMNENIICPYCKESVVASSNFCPNCGKPLSAVGRKRAEDGLVSLVQGVTSLVQ